jgi:hypothetical protein
VYVIINKRFAVLLQPSDFNAEIWISNLQSFCFRPIDTSTLTMTVTKWLACPPWAVRPVSVRYYKQKIRCSSATIWLQCRNLDHGTTPIVAAMLSPGSGCRSSTTYAGIPPIIFAKIPHTLGATRCIALSLSVRYYKQKIRCSSATIWLQCRNLDHGTTPIVFSNLQSFCFRPIDTSTLTMTVTKWLACPPWAVRYVIINKRFAVLLQPSDFNAEIWTMELHPLSQPEP